MAVEEAACCAATTIMKHFEKIVVGIGCTLVAETNTCGLWHFLTASKSTKRSISSLRGLMLSGLKSVCETPIGQDHGSFFRCQTAPWKYSYMLGGMVSLCSLAMCLRTISEYRKRSPQMRQCHWSQPNSLRNGTGNFCSHNREFFRDNREFNRANRESAELLSGRRISTALDVNSWQRVQRTSPAMRQN